MSSSQVSNSQRTHQHRVHRDHTVTWREEIVLTPRVPGYGVVPGGASEAVTLPPFLMIKKGGRVTPLVFNGRVLRLMCTRAVRNLGLC